MTLFIDKFYKAIIYVLSAVLLALIIFAIIQAFRLNDLEHKRNQLVKDLADATLTIEKVKNLAISTKIDSTNYALQHQIISKDEKIKLLTNSNLSHVEQLRAINTYISTSSRN